MIDVMKPLEKLLFGMIILGAAIFALWSFTGFVPQGIAAPPENGPPGQGECGHGNSQKPCKEDPQPDKGKDCEEHGNKGGENEDHCAGETTPPPPPCTVNCGPTPPCTVNCTTPPVTPPGGGEETPSNPSAPVETTPQPSTPAVSPGASCS